VTQTEEHLREKQEIREQEREQARLEAERQASEQLRLLHEEEERRRIEEDAERRRQEEEAEFAEESLDDWYAEDPEEDFPSFQDEGDQHDIDADAAWLADAILEAIRTFEEAEEEERRHREFLQAMREIMLQTGKVHTVVREIHSQSWRSSSHTFSLVPTRDVSLTSWELPNEKVELIRLRRYLCMIEKTGKLGWARVGSGRITYVEHSLNRSDLLVRASDMFCQVTLLATWQDYIPGRHNLQVILAPLRGGGKVHISCWFTPDSLRFIEFTPLPDNTIHSGDIEEICTWAKDNTHVLEEEMAKAILTPFLYNEKLIGVQANEFFGPPGTEYYLRLAKLHGQPVLIAE
jgi:hypothetical protein